jgi:23S rRNA pseudouridine1911/1915/1917 synthase
MVARKLSLRVSATDAGKRLDQFLAEALPMAIGTPVSKSKVRKLIIAGAVYLNRRRVRIASKILIANAYIEAYVDLSKLNDDATTQDHAFTMSDKYVLFEDDYLIAINKPPGLPTQPTVDEARNNLYVAMKQFLSTRDKITDPYLGLHHRLDRDTSGVMIFTKKQEANSRLAESFRDHRIEKVYHALTVRPEPFSVSDIWTVENYLGRLSSHKGKRAKYASVGLDGSFSRTTFRLIEDLKEALWIEARPQTGRTHQIRVHLSEQGMPILGDNLYVEAADNRSKKPKKMIKRLMLHALSIGFDHPINGSEVKIESPLPEDFKEHLERYRVQ